MILAYEILNGIYQQSVHSHLDWGRGFVGRYLIINPSRHWLHHATDSKYWGKNFGVLVFWERLFGTYRDLEGETLDTLQFGFANDPQHNQGRPWRSLWSIYLRFLGTLFRLRPVDRVLDSRDAMSSERRESSWPTTNRAIRAESNIGDV
jgi:hypothetical protein